MPNKGRLKEPAVELLKKAGLILGENGRCLSNKVEGENIVVQSFRAKDIPLYIAEGAVDVGITGYDIWKESRLELKELLDLKFGYCDLILAGVAGKKIKRGVRVGTSFPMLTANYFARQGIAARIIEVSGAVEILPKLGIADFVVDLTSTGATLRENGLVVLDKILSSSARLLCRRMKEKNVKFAERLREVIENENL
ncbi:MAG: ATP phosphoribosyltransferase [archaeon]